MTKIDLKSIIGAYRISVDKQIHINHNGCPAGEDRRKRLYVKRIGAGAYIGYCHNCGLSGYYFSDKPQRVEDLEGIRNTPPHGGGSLSTALLMDQTTTLPLHVQAYLLKYQVEPLEAVNDLKYKYCPSQDSLIMPFYQSRNYYPKASFQMRAMGADRGVRYTTYTPESHPKFALFDSGKSVSYDTVVIVEDQISGYRIMRDSDGVLSAIALMGTHGSYDFQECLKARQPKRVHIWMDNDAAGKAAAVKLYQELKVLLPLTLVHYHSGVQPKDMTVLELKPILDALKP